MMNMGIIIYYLIVIILILTRTYNKERMSVFVKTVLSIILISVAILSSSNEKWILIAIMFSAITDIFLAIYKIEKKSYLFYIAVILVTCSQLCLLVSSKYLAGFNYYSIFCAILINFGLYIIFSKIGKMKLMQKLSMIYSFIFLILVSNVIINIKYLNGIYLISIILYWISYVVLYLQKFIITKHKKMLDGINKVLYYTAQLLMIIYILK